MPSRRFVQVGILAATCLAIVVVVLINKKDEGGLWCLERYYEWLDVKAKWLICINKDGKTVKFYYLPIKEGENAK